MPLDYLDFDYSEDDEGTATWDALASVTAERVPALVAEVEQLLRWASRTFAGRRGPIEEGGEWDLDLHAQQDDGRPLAIGFDEASGHLRLGTVPGQRVTLGLTLSASTAFSEAMRRRYAID
ncbi:hypothetical protein [Comamonas endophytica]|uniref:Uncharacterized protein n=1 Tax=Comamonas endophytica TaxID=2949090 RepID=A0ABY6G9D9_9BURK|nr:MULTISPECIES: hypothetical protein [unclassified Acidovorax]MCD2511624.1 hypothetical protein [Acidovorax sp. D4N7]UYG51007.1 hypothetical protein M9799_13035 [Acidovorax sp. 5MLIR]